MYVNHTFGAFCIILHTWLVKMLNIEYSVQEICKTCFCRYLPEGQVDDCKLKTMPVIRLERLSETFV